MTGLPPLSDLPSTSVPLPSAIPLGEAETVAVPSPTVVRVLVALLALSCLPLAVLMAAGVLSATTVLAVLAIGWSGVGAAWLLSC